MNTRSIQNLRRKFIFMSMFAYLAVILFVGACINISNMFVTGRQINDALELMLEREIENANEHAASESQAAAADDGQNAASEERREERENSLDALSSEFRYSARYFTAAFSEEGELTNLNTSRSMRLTKEEAQAMAARAYERGRDSGRDSYFYYRTGLDVKGTTHLVFLNCASMILSNLRILYITLLIGAAGMVISLVLLYFLSYRVIQPELENARRQKQFITNASHELKTPLAVIRANTEIEEMMNGESEWTRSTMRQVDRLSGLVQNLVMISRAQEREDRSVMTAIDVSKNVEETVRPFESLAQQEEKQLIIDIMPDIHMVADESKIRQLASLLIDNAFKYCDEKGRIRVQLDTLKKGKTVRLIFSNTFAEGAGVNYSRFFERFYREDESHNVDKGGYGIGLSIAESICQQYGGSISVSWKNGEIAFTCLLT